MTASGSKILPKAALKSLAEVEALTTVALFSVTGLLISVMTIILDKYIPGDWF